MLIAEDEYLIRERIKAIIPWEELGYNMIQEAEDGQEVLDYLEKFHIDVIILDIKMPFFTGIDILKHIFNENKKVKVILATGHDKFEYAKKALDYGAIGYLLKPIKGDELKDLLIKAKAQIQKEMFLERQELFDAVKYNKPIIESLLINYAARLKLGSTFYMAIIKDFSLVLTEDTINKMLYYLKLKGISSLILERTKETCTLLMTCNLEEMYRILERIINIEMKHVSIKGYISNPCHSIEQLNTSYVEALKSFEAQIFFKHKIVLSYDFIIKEQDSSISFEQLVQYCDEIELALRTQDTQEVYRILELLFGYLRRSSNIALLKKVLLYFYFMLQNHELVEEDPEDYIDNIMNSSNGLTEIKTRIYENMKDLIKNTKAPNTLLVIKIKDYIEKNYTENTLSTDEISQYLDMNVSYISSVFKKTLDISITEYITKCRMEKAKMLLEENQLKIYEIATLVGYSNAFYFSNRFKRHYGLSPKNFIDRK